MCVIVLYYTTVYYCDGLHKTIDYIRPFQSMTCVDKSLRVLNGFNKRLLKILSRQYINPTNNYGIQLSH